MHELAAISAFSFLHGANQPEEMVTRAAELGYESIALTDHGGFYGSARAHAAARTCGLRAIVGTALPLGDHADPLCPHLPVLPRDLAAYQQLCQTLTDQNLEGRPALDALEIDAARAATAGSIALTGDASGKLCQYLLRGQRTEAMAHLRHLREIFGDRLYVQLTRHLQRRDLCRDLAEMASQLGLDTVVANAPHHARRADKLVADAFACLRHKTTLDRAGRLLGPNHERNLKHPCELRQLFADQPEAIANAARIAETIAFSLDSTGYVFPTYLGLPDENFHHEHDLLIRTCYDGARRRFGATLPARVTSQLRKELELIAQLRFSGYFLIVEDIVSYARTQGILCQGRGSAANSLVCYCLDITKVDPLACGLLFERFLSENRKSWPDIDIDFPSGERREKVIQYVYDKYSRRGAAMTANVITYKPRSAFREMAKILDFSEDVADRFSQMINRPRSEDPREEATEGTSSISPMEVLYGQPIADVERTIEESGVPRSHPRYKPLLHLYSTLQSLPRHLGQHSGGMIISGSPRLDHVVPIQPASMLGRSIVQWDKDDCEDLGIVKIDLLGLGMLAAMQDAIEITNSRGRNVDLALIPKDDPATYDLMCRADTVGTFQVESRAQMNTLPILQPRTFYDVAVEVAIIRPGPIVGELKHPYLNRRQGLEPIDYIHHSFEPILKRTLGVPLFQEQVLQMAMTIADFSGVEADELRRAMSFRRSDSRMKAITTKLRTNMEKKGIEPEVQDKIIHSIGSFALYGFPESHAISFALIAYASCYFKVHHTAEFFAALLNNQPMGFYSPASLLRDARRHGVAAKPVSVIDSEAQTTVIDDHHIRLGLTRIKGLRLDTIDRLLAARNATPFTGLEDFRQRVAPTQKDLRLLAEAGALNPLEENLHRRQALWEAERPVQLDLFKTADRSHGSDPSLPPMSEWARLASDYMTQGHTTGPHPMALLRKDSDDPKYQTRSSHLKDLPHNAPVTICGQVIVRQRPGTAKGHMFISLEDEDGIANIFVPRDTFKDYQKTILAESFLQIDGQVQIGEGGSATVYCHHLTPIRDAADLPIRSHDFH